MKGYIREVRQFLDGYVGAYSISSLRDPQVCVSRVFELGSLFFFSQSEERFLEGLKEKTLFSLWTLIMEDAIDNTEKGKDNIFDSLQVLTKFKRGENFNGKTKTGQIMHDFILRFHSFLSGPNKRIAEELVLLDLVKVINGFEYERIAGENKLVGTLSEYVESSAATMGFRVLLDIDIAICPYNVNPSTIEDLREAYRWFSLAFKMGSDIAAFEREYFSEKSHNVVILYGKERGLLSRDIMTAERRYKEKQVERVIPALMDDIEEKGRKYLSRSIEYLEKIKEVDTGMISKAFVESFENCVVQRTIVPPVV